MNKNLRQGTQIAHVPDYANGDIHHRDVELGFILTVAQMDYKEDDLTYFCYFWHPNHLGDIRQLGEAEKRYEPNLIPHKSVDQSIVDEFCKKAKTLNHKQFSEWAEKLKNDMTSFTE